MKGRVGLTNNTGLFVGAVQYPDRKRPSLVVQYGNQAVVVASFNSDKSAEYFATAIKVLLGEEETPNV